MILKKLYQAILIIDDEKFILQDNYAGDHITLYEVATGKELRIDGITIPQVQRDITLSPDFDHNSIIVNEPTDNSLGMLSIMDATVHGTDSNNSVINRFSRLLFKNEDTETVREKVNEALTPCKPIVEPLFNCAVKWFKEMTNNSSSVIIRTLISINDSESERELKIELTKMDIKNMVLDTEIVIPVIGAANQISLLFFTKTAAGKLNVQIFHPDNRREHLVFEFVYNLLSEVGSGSVQVLNNKGLPDVNNNDAAVHAVFLLRQWLSSNTSLDDAYEHYKNAINKAELEMSSEDLMLRMRSYLLKKVNKYLEDIVTDTER